MIQEGDHVIFKKGEYMKIFPVKTSKPIMIDRFKCRFDNLINQPYGFEYEIKEQQLTLKPHSVSDESKNRVEIVKDNRNLVDKSENQKLTKEDIEQMRSQDDVSGNQIIDRLIENSASFSQKTEYSQEKYIKKKKEKYLAVYRILKPTIRTLVDYYMMGNNKRKILNMRMDTIAQILTYSNVAANRNVMVLESCKGLLLAAIAERVAGHGKIVNFSPNGSHISTRETLEYMNFPAEHTKELYNFPLEKADKHQDYIEDLKRKIKIGENNEPYRIKQTEKLENAQIVSELFLRKQIDCLIIASKFRPLPILEKVIDYMGANRYFVIYSPIQEPLIECHTYLKQTRKAVHMELADNWLREYQVLPERTHPKVMMDCCSGFLLTGITVVESSLN